MKTPIKKIIVSVLVLAAVAAGADYYWIRSRASGITFRTSEVKRGDLVPTIGATGTVEPQEVVDVGAQVQGIILSFGNDRNGKPIDYGSSVTKGMLLARIDDTVYAATAANAAAGLSQAQAGVKRAIADLGQMNAKLAQAQSDWDRAQKLGKGDALSETDFNTYKANYETAVANLAVDEAAIDQAKASVEQAQANLTSAQQNLAYCTIKSPVDGVIIDRRVNIGQTVVSSLNAPSLFLIAKDLTQIQVWVSVNEADIGQIRAGQPVTFTVDAFSGRTFHGTVGKVRFNATMTQNVVTYTVEVDTDNKDAKLLPYLTANIQFEVSHERDALLVSNAALRWSPDATLIAPDARAEYSGRKGETTRAARTEVAAGDGQQKPQTAPSASQPTTRPHHSHGGGEGGQPSRGTVWVADGQYVRPISIKIGSSDGAMTQVISGDLKEGTVVVEGTQKAAAGDSAGTTNPFAPTMPRFGGGGGRPPR